MEKVYPKSHVMLIMGLNSLSFIIGLTLVAVPFIRHQLPGSFDTTVHVAIGAGIAVLSVFRLLLAYGAIWLDLALTVLGVLTLLFPTFMHLRYNEHYNLGHLVAGAVVVGVAVVSFGATMAVFRKMPH